MNEPRKESLARIFPEVHRNPKRIVLLPSKTRVIHRVAMKPFGPEELHIILHTKL